MQSIATNLFKYKEIPKQKTSERAELVKDIFAIYTSDQQKDFRKKENWKRYCQFCRDTKLPHSEVNVRKFKRDKKYIKEHTIKSFCFITSHIPTNDMHYVLSIAKDDQHRQKPFIMRLK